MKLTTRLSRSAVDATRFTATSPHAYSKPTPLRSAASASIPSSASKSNTPPYRFAAPNAAGKRPPQSAPPGAPTETPAEKVARLRAARLREREAQITNWDRVVVKGRSWADRAHKMTVYSLVTFSVVAAAITTFALTDMILHNRRKRSAFYAEQRSLYATRLLDAIDTEKAGLPLDEDQTLILNRERARVQAEELKKQRGWGKSLKGVFVGGLKEEEGGGREVGKVLSEGEVLERIGVGKERVLEAVEGEGRAESTSEEGSEGGVARNMLQAVDDKRREGEQVLEANPVTGGPLDQVAEEAVEKVKNTGGWLSWGR